MMPWLAAIHDNLEALHGDDNPKRPYALLWRKGISNSNR